MDFNEQDVRQETPDAINIQVFIAIYYLHDMVLDVIHIYYLHNMFLDLCITILRVTAPYITVFNTYSLLFCNILVHIYHLHPKKTI